MTLLEGMENNRVLSAVAVLALLFQTGRCTNLYVNFGNGTGQKISVKDTQTGQEVQVARRKGVITIDTKARPAFVSFPAAQAAASVPRGHLPPHESG